MRAILLAICLTLTLTATASAHGHRHHRHHPIHLQTEVSHHHYTVLAHAGLGPRPGAWCGWQMRQWMGGGPELNLARNWAHVGHSVGPEVGAIVVWPHHVGLIVGRAGSQWVVKSGNDGHRIRERPRSIAGAIAFRML